MTLLAILWIGFMIYIARIGEERANKLWIGMLAFFLVANVALFFVHIPG